MSADTQNNPIERAQPRENWPLTFAERQMAAEQGMDPASRAYNVNRAFELRGPLDAQKLEAALGAVVERHAALRSCYPLENGEFVHKVEKTLPVALRRENCPFDEVPGRIAAADVPYDLSRPPLFRFALYETGNEQAVLHVGMHHIIADAATIKTVMEEALLLYGGGTLAPLELDYPDYAVWQAVQPDDAQDEAFFKDMFADGLPENEMPTRPLRPERLPFADTDCVRVIDAGQLSAAAKRHGTTVFTLLFSAAALTLAKYCGSEDVVLGLALGGRTRPELEKMAGMFVNSLPLRVKTPADMTVADYVAAVAALLDGVKTRQTYPFERLVPLLAPERNPSRAPVFDITVNYLHAMRFPESAGLSVREIFIKRQALALDMTLEMTREDGGVRLVLSYSPKLYEPAVVEGMMEQLVATAGRMAGDGTALLCDAAELPDENRRQILEDFAGEKTDENLSRTVVDLFRDAAKRYPKNRAVFAAGHALTYAELDDMSDRLAACLAARGIGRGSAVGIMVHRGVNMPLCALGVLKSGAAYAPLDPSYPAERLEFMLEDAGAPLVIADKDLAGVIPGFHGDFLFTGDIPALPPAPPPAPPAPEDLMVLLYTSGTTGKPKGVMLLHRNLSTFCTWCQHFYKLTETDAIGAYASFGFDAHMMDSYPALISGACMVIVPEDMRLDLPGMSRYYKENNVTIAFFTTQLGRQFAETVRDTTLRSLSTGGEALVPLAPPEEYELYNLYGPTECTVLTTYFLVDRLYDRVPIGSALANTALYVVDKNGRLAPVGVAGELCVAGRQVAVGYLNRPDITEEKFTPNPFSNDPDYSRIYHTGDVVRFLPDGNIDFVGRRDFQVKIRGFRVELSEIEGRIRQYPGVTDAAVISLPAPGGGNCAAAYLVADAPVDVAALGRFIEEELPPYMVPAAIMQLDAIPLNPNGKVDRRKLPEPVFSSAGGDEDGPRVKSELEQRIADIAAPLLGHGEFGVTANLLQAGLTSLSAIRFVAALDEAFGVGPTVRDIMEQPTLLHIENIIVEKLLNRAAQPAQDGAEETAEQYPLSSSQLGVWLDCQKNPGSVMYNVPVMLTPSAQTDAERLAAAVRTVVDAHPVLKSRLALRGDEVVQLPGSGPAEVAVLEMDESELERKKHSFVRPFDLMSDAFYRAEVVKTPRRVVALLDIHHIVFDGGSLDLLLRQIGEAYDGTPLKEERLSAPAAAAEEKQAEGGPQWAEDKAYYDEALTGFEGVSEIPADLPHGGRVGALREVVRKTDTAAVEAFCKEHGVTPAGLLLAASAYAVGRWVQTPTAYLSAVSSGREDPRLAASMGMFVRTVPLAVRREPGQTALAYIRAAQSALTGAVAHSGYPYTEVARQYGYSPAVMYTCELGVTAGYRLGGAPLDMELLELAVPKFKLSIHVEERDGIVFAVQYDDARYSKQLMEAFADTLAVALQNLMAAPDGAAAAVQLQTAHAARLVAGFNETGDPGPERVLHRLFEDAARRFPDRTALIAAEGQYTYAQLDAEANRVANGLLARGVRREDRVALLLRRTGRVLIGMLGALKAGCAYIPLDPDYPPERIAHVLADSGAGIVLTTPDTAGDFTGAVDIDALRAGMSTEAPGVEVWPGQVAYLIYTSGSTGKPKGVMIEHRSIANYVADAPQNRHIHALVREATRMMSITTVAFDMFLKEGMASLCNGLTLVFADDDTAHDPVRLAKLFDDTGADAFNTTPSLMLEYTEYPPLLAAIRRCRVIMAGAEKYPERLLSRLKGAGRLFNTYGPTEITVSCNAKELTGASRVTVGPPLLGVHEQVADADGNPLPPLMVGELLIGGRGVARGYVGLPEQTAEKFVDFNGERVYRSGDYARWTADGDVEILGRSDNQIKLRGLRIELGEVEAALAAVPGVSACAVTIRTLQNADHLCAWYVAARAIDADEMRTALARTLTGYMVPTAYLQIDAIPKTPGGKDDLRALPSPELLRSGEYVPPRGETEEKLCAVFAAVLGAERVGAEDNFFDAGGTSLAVTRVIIGAEEAGVAGPQGEKISYGDVFANPTPRALAALLSSGAAPAAAPAAESGYDYAGINALLAGNNLDALRRGAQREIGNVLLAGATGFLGVHMLSALLECETGTIVCLVRPGAKTSAAERLKGLLYYYFETVGGFDSRVVVLEGDMTGADALSAAKQYGINTVINCAANVSHFAKDEKTYDVNVLGVQNLIDFCRDAGAMLVQVSTASVAGFSVGGVPPADTVMDETMLYFGQNLENQYVHSKFLAERAVLEASLAGLEAKIMRVGNLMARNRDGEFQINARANSFLGRLRAFAAVGCFPYSSYRMETEFAPIDSTVAAILLLARTGPECRVFHPYNDHGFFMGDVILTMKELGIPIELVEDEVFQSALSAAMKDPALAEQLTSIIAYQNIAQGRAAVPVKADNRFTTQALLRMGWRWPLTDGAYLEKFLRGLVGLGLFGGGAGV